MAVATAAEVVPGAATREEDSQLGQSDVSAVHRLRQILPSSAFMDNTYMPSSPLAKWQNDWQVWAQHASPNQLQAACFARGLDPANNGQGTRRTFDLWCVTNIPPASRRAMLEARALAGVSMLLNTLHQLTDLAKWASTHQTLVAPTNAGSM